MRPPRFPPNRSDRHGDGLDHGLGEPGCSSVGEAADSTLPRSQAGQDGGRGDDPQPGHLAESGTEPPAPLRLRQRHPLLRHGRLLRLGAGASARWLKAMPEVRKEIFLVTKDHPNTPRELIAQLDERLAALHDRLRRPVLHPWHRPRLRLRVARVAQEPGVQGDDRGDQEVGQGAVRRLLVPRRAAGPSISRRRPRAGFVDAIMLQYTPWLDKDAALNRALDACHKQGIGLISMKQVAGQSDRILQEVPRRAPALNEKGLTPYQALLARDLDRRADRHVAASRCGTPTRSARTRRPRAGFAPLKQAEIEQLTRCLPRRRPDLLRRLRRPLRRGRRHHGRPRRPDPPLDLPRPVRLPRRGAAALRRAARAAPRTGQAPTSKRPGRPAPTSSTSPRSCRGSTATWPDRRRQIDRRTAPGAHPEPCRSH